MIQLQIQQIKILIVHLPFRCIWWVCTGFSLLVLNWARDVIGARVGVYCDKKIQFCTKEFNPCKNGATCQDHDDHYTCQCTVGFSGENCTINNDDCIQNMCQVRNPCFFATMGPQCRLWFKKNRKIDGQKELSWKAFRNGQKQWEIFFVLVRNLQLLVNGWRFS